MTIKMTPIDLRECLTAFWDAKRHRFREMTRDDLVLRCGEHFEKARVMAGKRGWLKSHAAKGNCDYTRFYLTPEGEAFAHKVMAARPPDAPARRLTCNPAHAATHVAKTEKATLRPSYAGV